MGCLWFFSGELKSWAGVVFLGCFEAEEMKVPLASSHAKLYIHIQMERMSHKVKIVWVVDC